MQFTIGPENRQQQWMLLTFLLVLAVSVVLVFKGTFTPPKTQVISDVRYWHDSQNEAALDKVLELPDNAWQAASLPVNLGLSQSPYWLDVALSNGELNQSEQWLEIHYPLLDSASVWLFDDSDRLLDSVVVGDSQPFSQRPFQHETFVFDLSQYSQVPQRMIVRVASSGMLKVPMRLWAPEDFLAHSASDRIAIGVFFGLLIAMAISNFFFFLTTKSPTFLVYAGYVLGLTLVLATLHGYSFQYIWPHGLWMQQHALAVFANGTIALAVLFSYLLLDVKAHSVWLAKVLKIMIGVFCFNLIASVFLPYFYLIQVFLILLLITVAVVFGLSVWLSLNKVIIARYYTLAWLVMLVCAFASGLDNLHIIDLPVSSSTLLMYGAGTEALLLALVLAISYGTQQDELKRSQALALSKEKETADAKDKLLEVEQQAKDELEYKVQERTLELEITLRELSEANQELERLNTLDALTGIRNRRHFDKRILAEGRRSRREQTNLCLVMLDIDHFKRINDEYGHDVGDSCIQHVASLAKNAIKRPSDDLCRYGGEEFAFILPNTSEEGAEQFINAIRQQIEQTPCTTESVSVAMTISAGIASAIVTQEGGEKRILKAADEALYAAKQNGRNRVVVASNSEN